MKTQNKKEVRKMKSKRLILGILIVIGLVLCLTDVYAQVYSSRFYNPTGTTISPNRIRYPQRQEVNQPPLETQQDRGANVTTQAEGSGAFVRSRVRVRMEYIDLDGDGIPDRERMTRRGNETIRTEDGQTITRPVDDVQTQDCGRYPYGSGLFENVYTESRNNEPEQPDVFQWSRTTRVDGTGKTRAMEILVRSVGRDGTVRWVLIRRTNITYDGLGRVEEYDETTEEITEAEARNWLRRNGFELIR